jgi:hypothetical protein
MQYTSEHLARIDSSDCDDGDDDDNDDDIYRAKHL